MTVPQIPQLTQTSQPPQPPHPDRLRATTLLAVELRKLVDTRAGRSLLAGTAATSLAALAYGLAHIKDHTAVFSDMIQGAATPLLVLLPALAVLAMTGEWTHRTALVTFTLAPRRTGVLLAKAGAVLLLGALATGLVVLATALAALAGGAFAGHLSWARAGTGIGMTLAGVGVDLLMALAFGSLIAVSPAALVAYYVVPTVWGGLLTGTGDWSKWVNITDAVARITHLHVGGAGPQTAVAVGLWVLLPAAVGLTVAARRDIR